MLKVLMLDLGETLVSGNRVLPNAINALEIIDGFVTLEEKNLMTCLVSDFHLADPLGSKNEIKRLFEEYLNLLDDFGLRMYFEPTDQRVTLSTHAGVSKPHKKVFELALDRLGTEATLNECLFVTENKDHLDVCHDEYGMSRLQFGSKGKFDNWSDGLLRIAWLLSPDIEANITAAVQFYAETRLNLSSVSSISTTETRSYKLRGKVWNELSAPSMGNLAGVQVELPIDVFIELDTKGGIHQMKEQKPTPESIREATHYIQLLEKNQSISFNEKSIDPRKTHTIELTKNGQRRLVRVGFSKR